MEKRVHITGAAGSGTTTLGRALAQHLALPHFDTDDFYWLPVEPAYSKKRDPAARIRLMQELFAPRRAWILSGSLMGWGDDLAPLFDLVVFLRAPTDERLNRLRQREMVRVGAAAIAEGGARYQDHVAFLDWATQYDRSDFDGRSLQRHEVWLAELRCPIVRLDSTKPVDDLVAQVTVEMVSNQHA